MSQVLCGLGKVKDNSTASKVATFIIISEEHKLLFSPPWEYLAGDRCTVLITTGYGMVHCTITKNKKFEYCFFSGEDNIYINNYGVDGDTIFIETSVIFSSTQIVFCPVTKEYFNSL